VRGAEYGLRTTDVGDAFLAQAAKSVAGLQDSPVVSSDLADNACPTATMADALSLPP
jgi:hypothetical protein